MILEELLDLKKTDEEIRSFQEKSIIEWSEHLANPKMSDDDFACKRFLDRMIAKGCIIIR
jgi:hypothetical protein